MALQRPHHLNWLDPGKTHTFQLIQLIRPTPNTHISTTEHLKMFTTVFLSFLQFFYSSETGYAIQHALQMVRKQKYFPMDWATCYVNFSKHLWTHSWMTGVGEEDKGEGGEAAWEPACKRTKCCQLFLGMRFIFIFHTSGTIVYILPGFQMWMP